MSHNHPVFREGETTVQDRAGVTPRIREVAARVICDAMPEQHQAFFEALPLIFLTLLDQEGRPWAMPMFGAPGFARATSARQLVLIGALILAESLALDTSAGAPIGLLGIDFRTRRRNRMNDRIVSRDRKLTIAVEQSFGNCPK